MTAQCKNCGRPVWDGGHALTPRECSGGEECALVRVQVAAERVHGLLMADHHGGPVEGLYAATLALGAALGRTPRCGCSPAEAEEARKKWLAAHGALSAWVREMECRSCDESEARADTACAEAESLRAERDGALRAYELCAADLLVAEQRAREAEELTYTDADLIPLRDGCHATELYDAAVEARGQVERLTKALAAAEERATKAEAALLNDSRAWSAEIDRLTQALEGAVREVYDAEEFKDVPLTVITGVCDRIRSLSARASTPPETPESDLGGHDPLCAQEQGDPCNCCKPCRSWTGTSCEQRRLLHGPEGCPGFVPRATPPETPEPCGVCDLVETLRELGADPKVLVTSEQVATTSCKCGRRASRSTGKGG